MLLETSIELLPEDLPRLRAGGQTGVAQMGQETTKIDQKLKICMYDQLTNYPPMVS
jgi:hypothetical protein